MDNFEEIISSLKTGNFSNIRKIVQRELKRNPNDEDAKLLDLIFQPNDPMIYLSEVKLKMLNLGCGNRFHPDWVNVDFVKTAPEVIQHDLKKGIPFDDNSFDVVYHSHLLEHFPKNLAVFFIKECFRVLKPGGIIRVVVPDLENITRTYLQILEECLQGNEIAQKRYEWILLELFDQMVRNYSGGEMLEYWAQYPMPAEDFVLQRMGSEAKNAIEYLKSNPNLLNQRKKYAEDPYEIGKFRLSGEVHYWMYDRYSLQKLLLDAGFTDFRICKANESRIPNFNIYLLDIEADGSVRKPDSLFVEALKPQDDSIVQNSFKTKNISVPRKNIKESKPKIVHLSVWDSGGAGTAALRLHLALLNQGYDSKFLVLYKSTDLESVIPVKRKEISKSWDWSQYYELWNKFLFQRYPNRPKDLEIFTSVESIADLKDDENIKNADIINFHWISSLVDFKDDFDVFQGKKIVWTMHDENPFTGGCHFTSNCQKFQSHCSGCPQLSSNIIQDLSYYQFEIKRNFYKTLDLTIVAPSKWLANKALQSKLLGEKEVFVIPNGLPLGIFHYYDKEAVNNLLKIPLESFIILFGADYFTKRKGYHFLNDLIPKLPKTINGKPVILVTFGSGQTISTSNVPVFNFGRISNPIMLAMIYSMADIYLHLAMEDNLPNTCIESICCGTPVVAFNIGGIPDIVKHKENGWLAEPYDLEQIIKGINFWGKNEKIDKYKLSFEAQKRFNSELQAKNYINLYNRILNNKESFIKEDIDNDFMDLTEYFETLKIFIPTQRDLKHFYGLDIKYDGKSITPNNISTEEYIRYLILKICLSKKEFSNQILIIFDKHNFILPKLPSFINLNLIYLDLENTKIFNIENINENSIIHTSLDNLELAFDTFQNELGFGFLSFDNLINHKISISHFIEQIQRNLTRHSKIILFLEASQKKFDQLIREVKFFFEKAYNEHEQISYLNIKSYSNNILTFWDNGKEKYLVGIVLDKASKLEFLKEKIIYYTDRRKLIYPRISIITPNYNGGEYLEECIESIISQNYPNLEYIIIDGGSKDNSLEIIKKYEKYLTYWISEPDKGQYDAINKGFAKSTGEIMAWLNADDLYLPGALYFIADFFLSFNNFLWVTSGIFCHITFDGFFTLNKKNKVYSYRKYLNNEWNSPFIMQESTFWRRELWEKVGGELDITYDFAGDMELWCRFFRITTPAVLNIPIAIFRFNPKQKTATNFNRYEMQAKELVLREQNFVKQNNISNFPISQSISFEKFVEQSGLKYTMPELKRIFENYKNFLSKRKLTNYAQKEFNLLIKDFETIINYIHEKECGSK